MESLGERVGQEQDGGLTGSAEISAQKRYFVTVSGDGRRKNFGKRSW
jgi:hypothetical protein